MRLRAAETVAMIVILSGCAGIRFDGSFTASDRDWTTYGGSLERVQFTHSDLPPPFERVWTYNAQGGILATPLVRDNVLVVATLHGELQLVSLQDGKRLGYVSLGGPIKGTPVLSGLYVIVPLLSEEASLLYFGLREGRTFWKADLGPIGSSPLLIGDMVYVSTLDGEICAVDRSNGEEVWRFAPSNKKDRKPFRTSPLRAGDLIICGNDDGIIYAVRSRDGSPVWSTRTDSPIFASPILIDDRVIVANTQGLVLSLDARSGEHIWGRTFSAPIYASPSSDGTFIFIATASGEVISLDALTGESRWKWKGESVINASPLVSDTYLYVGSLEKRFFVLDKRTGENVWTYDIEGRMKVPAVTWNDRLIIVYEDRTIEALQPANGR